MTHNFSKLDISFDYYKCAHCGLIAYCRADGTFIVSSQNHVMNEYKDAAQITCNDFIICNIIK